MPSKEQKERAYEYMKTNMQSSALYDPMKKGEHQRYLWEQAQQNQTGDKSKSKTNNGQAQAAWWEYMQAGGQQPAQSPRWYEYQKAGGEQTPDTWQKARGGQAPQTAKQWEFQKMNDEMKNNRPGETGWSPWYNQWWAKHFG
jgi:hypothetical protein